MTTLNTSIIKSLVDHTGDDTSIIPDGSVPILDVSGNLTVNGKITANDDISITNGKAIRLTGFGSYGWGPVVDIGYLRFANSNKDNEVTYLRMTSNNNVNLMTFTPEGVKIDKSLTVSDRITTNNDIVISGKTVTRYLTIGDEQNADNKYSLFGENGKVIIRNDITRVRATLLGGSQTITHESNVIGELGTFCEATGNIYDGYDNISNTDCICNVQTATTLNKKIVGIICSEDEFASHGDVYVKVNDINGLEIGDILCPDENGYGKKASETDLMYMMLHAIPRPKITSLDTAFEGYVACFLV